jgi:hypothetical protein
MSVTMLEIVRAARARAVPLPAESAGYLVLLLADRVQHAPRRIELTAIELDDEGSVQSLAGEPLEPLALETALRRVLSELLAVSSSAGPSLLRAAARPATGNVPAFVAELERALVPVNRTAARRALVRLCRETERARREGTLIAEEAPEAVVTAQAAARPPIEPVTAPPLAAAVSPEPPPALSSAPPPATEESSTKPETVVALSDSGRPPPRDWSASSSPSDPERAPGDRTPCIGSFGSDPVTVPRAAAAELPVLSPDLPTAAPPAYASPAPSPRRVDDLVAAFEVAPALSDESLRAELKRVAGVEGTPGPAAVQSGARRNST